MTYIRSEELLKRWTELSTFGAGLFRTHIGSSTTPLDAQVYDNAESMAHFAQFGNIFGQLSSYRDLLIEEAQSEGMPLMR
jgi:alpha-glucosidase